MTEKSKPMKCSEAVERLWDYLDHAISPEEELRVEQHLAFCRKCCGEVEFAKEMREFLNSNAVGEMPPHVTERLHRFIEEL
ncbi:MAG TPA: zf-HC2 domain-containing protein [Acidimicrobiia bacterium]|nr:zf-HC2 domain-containing protein [Acidimicrobiia bacterium]